ncbi:hypothetical protein [Bacillus paramycoides]|uniref:hypothetical protein n=1 Tax=Bacillus paramycoides TaxID=2026194 RepID=UPI002E247A78|nr:hypothetical protein [Bacillus paramycoides]
MKRYLESEEIRGIIDHLYSKEQFQNTIDQIQEQTNIKLSRYKVELAESWSYESQKTMKILILSYANGSVELMYTSQDKKELITFTSLKNQKIFAA